jgi:hypothetical protein
MTKPISTKLAGNILLIIFGLLMVFHILVLLNLLPSDIVWGGQAGDLPLSLRTLETISLIFTALFAIVVAAKIGHIKIGKFISVINVLLWIILAYLFLNTVGNFFSSSSLERLVFTPITIAAAFLVFRLAIEK